MLLERRHRLAQEAPHLLLTEHASDGSAASNSIPTSASTRLELAEAVDQVAARIARAEEAEDVVVTLPEQRRGRPSVGSSSAWSHSSSARLSSSRSSRWSPRSRPCGRGGPGRRRPSPKADARARRGRSGGERGVGCGQPSSRRSIAFARPTLAARAHAVGAQAVAGDLVDEHRVEVVHRRLPVAREGARADCRQRGGDRGERGLDALVEGRAPERVPPALTVVEERMDEPLGDRAPRQLDDREDRARLAPSSRPPQAATPPAPRAAPGRAGAPRSRGPRAARRRSRTSPRGGRRRRARRPHPREDERRRVVLPDDLEVGEAALARGSVVG